MERYEHRSHTINAFVTKEQRGFLICGRPSCLLRDVHRIQPTLPNSEPSNMLEAFLAANLVEIQSTKIGRTLIIL